MTKWFRLFLIVLASAIAGRAHAQYPVLDAMAQKVISKFQSATCEQLWQQRGQPKSTEEERAVEFLRNDPSMRQAFFNQIAGPVVNKMFECGMIP
jgi:hypothetical protein